MPGSAEKLATARIPSIVGTPATVRMPATAGSKATAYRQQHQGRQQQQRCQNQHKTHYEFLRKFAKKNIRMAKNS
jgi:hypothetical protein